LFGFKFLDFEKERNYILGQFYGNVRIHKAGWPEKRTFGAGFLEFFVRKCGFSEFAVCR